MARRLKIVLLCLLNGLIGLAIFLSPAGPVFERSTGLTALFKIRGERETPADVAVIAINGQTGEDLGLAPLPRDWPRSIHGDLIDKLTQAGAAAIVFDIHFGTDKIKAHDEALAKAAANSQRVVVVERLTGKMQPIRSNNGETTGAVWVENVLPPFPALADAAKGIGTFTLPKIDSSVYDFITFKQSADSKPTLPALGLQLLAEPVREAWNEQLRALNVPEDLLLPSPSALSAGRELGERMARLKRFLETSPGIVEAVPDPQERAESENTRLLAALWGLYLGPSERYLNFYGSPGTIRNIPYQDVLGAPDRLDAVSGAIRDSVVFVGYSDLFDPGQPDRFHTIYTNKYGVDLAGVEIAATSFANLLNSEAIQPLNTGYSALFIFLWGIALTALLSLAAATRSVPLAILVLLGYGALCQHLFSSQQLWLPLATPILIQAPLAFAVGIMGQYLFERRRGAQFSEAIRQYVPDSVVNDLVSGDFNPSDANKVIYSVCLATDMAGFSTIAEGMAPGELARFLNNYFDAMAAPLHDNGVDVTEFRADAIMCAWTGAEQDPNVRLNALRAALDSRKAIELFKAKNPQLQSGGLRIGLEAGNVYVGHAGGGGHFAYSIVGDAANTASRLESLNKHLGTTIIASGSVVTGFESQLAIRHLGDFQLKGKNEPLPVVEIIADQNSASSNDWRLIELFSTALEDFRRGDWNAAKNKFQAVLDIFANDQASRLYSRMCDDYLKATSLPERPHVVVMDAK